MQDNHKISICNSTEWAWCPFHKIFSLLIISNILNFWPTLRHNEHNKLREDARNVENYLNPVLGKTKKVSREKKIVKLFYLSRTKVNYRLVSRAERLVIKWHTHAVVTYPFSPCLFTQYLHNVSSIFWSSLDTISMHTTRKDLIRKEDFISLTNWISILSSTMDEITT